MSYQQFVSRAGDPVLKKLKQIRQSAHPINIVNWRLPKSKRPQGLCVMPQGEKFLSESRKMTLNIRYGNGAFVVVRGRENRLHGEGAQLLRAKVKN